MSAPAHPVPLGLSVAMVLETTRVSVHQDLSATHTTNLAPAEVNFHV